METLKQDSLPLSGSGRAYPLYCPPFHLSRNTIRKYLRTDSTATSYKRQQQPKPRLAAFESQLADWLKYDQALPRKQRRTARRLFECLQEQGYQGAYDSIQRYVKAWRNQPQAHSHIQAFVPLDFAPAQAIQFDWSQE